MLLPRHLDYTTIHVRLTTLDAVYLVTCSMQPYLGPPNVIVQR